MPRPLALIAAAALLPALAPAAACAATKTVYAGPPPGPKLPKQLDFDAFFRKSVTVNAGGSVTWQFRGFHNVVFPARGQKPPVFAGPLPGSTVSGVVDAAGVPFWFNGQPNIALTPEAAFPVGGRTEDGSALTGSGIDQRAHPKPYTLRFPKTGTFRYLCLVHPGMTGTVRVVPKGQPVPSAAADRAAAAAERAAGVALAARQMGKTALPRDTVLAGNDIGPVAWLRFFPQSLSVSAGTTVTFRVASKPEGHTVTIGPEAYTGPIEKGLVDVAPNAGGPPSLILNPLGIASSDPLPLPPFTGANHGNGFESTGILDTDPTTPYGPTAQITFATPGTYRYECVLHPGMDGEIRVS